MAKQSRPGFLPLVLLVAVGATAGAFITHKLLPVKSSGPGHYTSVPDKKYSGAVGEARGLPQSARGHRHPVVFGMIDRGLILQTPQQQARQLTRMKALGITSLRLDVNWKWVQPNGPSTYNWNAVDPEIEAVRAARLAVDVVIDGCPPWAALPGTSGDPSPQPASARQFAIWASAVARHYAPMGIKDFEIWNEPNDSKYWQPAANPVFYTDMLKAAYKAMKRVDKSAFIVSGGLAPVRSGAGSDTAISFLQVMYAHGAGGYFDALGDHPYSYPALPSTFEPWSAWSQMSDTTPSIRSVMRRYGDARKPVWITEFGSPSRGPAGIGELGQAAEFRQAIDLAVYTPWIGAIYLYTWQDIISKDGPNAGYFGLLTLDEKIKPAYVAVRAAIRTASRR